jgi:predicted nucleic acid-binding Zn ribbon protein
MSFVRDWKCGKCGAISPDVPTNVPDQYCPYCGEPMNKIYTPPLVTFTGPGWTEHFHTRNGGK